MDDHTQLRETILLQAEYVENSWGDCRILPIAPLGEKSLRVAYLVRALAETVFDYCLSTCRPWVDPFEYRDDSFSRIIFLERLI
jgi:hypothetical protein